MRIEESGAASTMLARPTPGQGRIDGFGDLLRQSLAELNTLQTNAENSIAAFSAGMPVSPDEVAAAVNQADLAFRMMVQIRNKLVSAWQELRQMQI